MTEEITINIPHELEHPFFFLAKEKLIVERKTLQTMNINIPFLYEAAYYSGIDAMKPWEMKEECIPLLISEWKKIKSTLDELFLNRSYKQALEPMKKGISLLLEFIYWANESPVQFFEADFINKLAFRPVNIGERLSFIIERPSFYHSFIQLSELMVEMEKQYVKKLAVKKASKQ